MNIQILLQLSRIILLAAAVSLVVLVLIYVLQNPNLILSLATVSWNGSVSH